MPFASKRQARWMYANHPDMAKKWSDHTPDHKKLPETAKEKKAVADAGFDESAPGASPSHAISGGALKGGLLGGLLGGVTGHMRGNTPEGLGRGLIRGGATGAGLGLGSFLGVNAANHISGDNSKALALLAGPLLGGAAGYFGSGRLMGPAAGVGRGRNGRMTSGEDEEEEKMGSDVATLGRAAARIGAAPYVEKLASDAGTGRELVLAIARGVGMPPEAFVKAAYADPPAFLAAVALASGVTTRQKTAAWIEKRAMGGKLGELMLKLYKSNGGRKALPYVAGGTALATGGVMAHRGSFSGAPSPSSEAPAAIEPPAPEAPASPASPALSIPESGVDLPPPSPTPGASAPAGRGSNVPLLGALGLLGGGAAAYAYSRRKKKRSEKMSVDKSQMVRVMRLALEKKSEDIRREAARRVLVTHFDKVASYMPMDKQAAVRTLQAYIAAGRPLAQAIKVAYPHLHGEARGVLASRIVASACKSAAETMPSPFKPKVAARASGTVPAAKGAARLRQLS